MFVNEGLEMERQVLRVQRAFPQYRDIISASLSIHGEEGFGFALS
jgi:hypothetical protein